MTIRCLFRLTAFLLAIVASNPLPADPVTRRVEIDFGRSAPSRHLAGLAARSDGRLVAGPFVSPAGPADLPAVLWRLVPAGPDRWLLGGGPDGRVLELRHTGGRFETRAVARLPGAHVFALLPLDGDRFLAGTSPDGGLALVERGQVVARVVLPADSVFDLAAAGPAAAWIATGNPGRLLRVDLAAFARAGIQEEKSSSDALLARAGVTRVAEVRDRNLRRLLVRPDGRVLAGSAPAGLVYQFPAAGGPPVILHETAGAEITSLVAGPDGSVYFAAVAGQTPPERRAIVVTVPAPAETAQAAGANPAPAVPPAAATPSVEFAGRSEVIRLSPDGFAETLVSRNGLALYDLLLRGDQLLLAGGENGELAAFDLRQRLLLTFAGGAAAQNTALAPLGADRVLVLQNNFPGLAVLDFTGRTPRTAETSRIDLGSPAALGSIGFLQLPGAADGLRLEYRTSNGSDETEGWTPWAPAPREGARFALRDTVARYLKLRLTVPAGPAGPFEIGRATVFAAPQNRPPSLQDFRILPPNLALAPAPALPAATAQPLAALLLPGPAAAAARDAGEAAKNAFLGSQVYPMPGNQLVYWSATDGEGDNLAAAVEIRPAGGDAWTTVGRDLASGYASFSTGGLADGVYVVRLTVAEQAPRPAAARLSTSAELDELVIDRTAPEILDAAAARTAASVQVTVRARDALSLLAGATFAFNHGADFTVATPVDGVLDGREETFLLELPAAAAAGASAVTATVTDAAGNRATRRIELP